MESEPPARLLEQRASMDAVAQRRGPVAFAIVLAIALLAGAFVVQGAMLRAARLAVRGQGSALVESIRRDCRDLGRPPSAGDLRRIVDAHARDGLRYVATLGDDDAVTAAAGQPLGTGTPPGEPRRFGKNLRVVLPSIVPPEGLTGAPSPPDGPAPPKMVFEFEPIAANDIGIAARVTLVVVLILDAMMIALSVVFARSLRAREALAASLAAENRLAALGEMSAVLAHELRNPLTSLKGHAQLLAEVLPEGSAQKTKADRVVGEAVRLERLTNDLLDFVRTGELHRRAADPREVVTNAANAVGGSIVTTIAPSLSTFDLDPDRLGVALENLLRNAKDASREAPVEVSAVRDRDGALVIAVRDHGAGIPAGEEEAIFRPFRTGKWRGVGLGLAIARRIVELHGGSLDATNHEGGGAVFRIRIPQRASSV